MAAQKSDLYDRGWESSKLEVGNAASTAKSPLLDDRRAMPCWGGIGHSTKREEPCR